SILDLDHADAAGNGTYKRTEVAADTFVFEYLGHMLQRHSVAKITGGPLFHPDTLVRAVFAGDIAEIAADAFLGVDPGDDFVIQVEVAPVFDAGDRLTHQFHH